MEIFEKEEISIAVKRKPVLSSIMCEGWKSHGVWFWHCLTSTNAMISLVGDHNCPRFSRLSSKAEEIFSQYWCLDSIMIIARKVADQKAYIEELKVLFGKQAEGHDS